MDPIITFQHYVSGAENTSVTGYDTTIAGFPRFQVAEADEPLGFLSYGGHLFGDTVLGRYVLFGYIVSVASTIRTPSEESKIAIFICTYIVYSFRRCCVLQTSFLKVWTRVKTDTHELVYVFSMNNTH